MMSRLLQINGVPWQVSFLGERVINLSIPEPSKSLDAIFKASRMLESIEMEGLVDVISSYENIGLVFEHPVQDVEEVLSKIEDQLGTVPEAKVQSKLIEVPVCYSLGLDWEEVESHLSKSREEVIEVHSSQTYTVAMMGFMPGFLYLAGLDESLACPRKKNPRTKIPAGSVGIGGTQTGIYSLESPGGWQIIGQATRQFFEATKTPPINISPGDRIRFTPISEEKYKRGTK